MKALWKEQVIAESDSTLEVDGYHYFPRESVRMEFLAKVEKTPRDLECPHGVQFYDVGDSARSAWSYEAPQEKMKPIERWIGFWQDVEVS